MNRLLSSLTIAALIASPLAFPTAANAKASTAQPTCQAGDPVVWVNTKSKVYHMQGDSYYGKTKSGMYACKSDADAKGNHAAGTGKMSAAPDAASPAPKHKKKHRKPVATPSPSP